SNASARRCAEECQKVDFPFSSFQVRIFTEAFPDNGRERSHTSPSTSMARAFLASPSLMDLAISAPVTPSLNSFVLPSGKVMVMFIALKFAYSCGCKYAIFSSAKEKSEVELEAEQDGKLS